MKIALQPLATSLPPAKTPSSHIVSRPPHPNSFLLTSLQKRRPPRGLYQSFTLSVFREGSLATRHFFQVKSNHCHSYAKTPRGTGVCTYKPLSAKRRGPKKFPISGIPGSAGTFVQPLPFPAHALLFPYQARMRPGKREGLLSKPGKTGLRSATPIWLERISPSTERKSVVSTRSRPSFN